MSEQSRREGDSIEGSGRGVVDRRKLLASMGAAGALALAGCSSGNSEGTPTGDETETDVDTTEQPTEDDEGAETSEIGARFGYTATQTYQEPPVEPDHTVSLEIKPRQDREIPEFYFEPAGLFVEPGDTVRFDFATPHHNVNAYHPALGYTQRVPDGVPAFSSPVLTAGSYWLYTFEQEGVHDIMCAPHEIFGMVGRIVVGSASGPGANPVGEAPGGERARPPEFTAGLVLSDEAMAPDNIVEQGSVSWSDVADENKRIMLEPAQQE